MAVSLYCLFLVLQIITSHDRDALQHRKFVRRGFEGLERGRGYLTVAVLLAPFGQLRCDLDLGLLVDLRKGIVYQGGRLQLAAVQPNIRELLQVTGLEDLFEFIPEAPALV